MRAALHAADAQVSSEPSRRLVIFSSAVMDRKATSVLRVVVSHKENEGSP